MARFQWSLSGPAIASAHVHGSPLIVVDASAGAINASVEGLTWLLVTRHVVDGGGHWVDFAAAACLQAVRFSRQRFRLCSVSCLNAGGSPMLWSRVCGRMIVSASSGGYDHEPVCAGRLRRSVWSSDRWQWTSVTPSVRPWSPPLWPSPVPLICLGLPWRSPSPSVPMFCAWRSPSAVWSSWMYSAFPGSPKISIPSVVHETYAFRSSSKTTSDCARTTWKFRSQILHNVIEWWV